MILGCGATKINTQDQSGCATTAAASSSARCVILFCRHALDSPCVPRNVIILFGVLVPKIDPAVCVHMG